MKALEKRTYKSPEIQTLKLASEDILAASNEIYIDGGSLTGSFDGGLFD